MADNYYYICTSDEFRHVTGQLINHNREIIRPSTSETGIAQLKNIFGSRSYPQYANDHQHAETLWNLGIELAKNAK
jgi:hypothetical protein